MSMKVSLLLSMDGGKIVKAEIDQVTAAVRKAGDASQEMGRKAGTSAGGVDRLARAADGATTEVLGLDAAQKTAAVSTTQLARSQTLAAGATGGHVLVVKATISGEGLFVTSFRRISGDAETRRRTLARLRRRDIGER